VNEEQESLICDRIEKVISSYLSQVVGMHEVDTSDLA
jgi:hypothetical protein